MKGSTVKRCSCAPEYDRKGRRKACPKKHGSWSYVIDAGIDPTTGKRRQVRKSGFKTQAEAESAMAEAIAEVDQGRFRHDQGRKVEDYCEEWLRHKATDYRATTMANATRWLRATYPHIGHLRLRDLQASHLTAMYRAITEANAKRGVTSTTTRRIHAILRAALSDARRQGYIRHNPASDAIVPKERRSKVDPWTGEELGRFLDHAATDPMGTLFETIAAGGLRRGEALGLRWGDVDGTKGVLVIRQQLVAVEHLEPLPCEFCGGLHRGIMFGRPKTSSGEGRRVDLSPTAIGALLEHRLVQDAQRAELGPAYRDHGLVFADAEGNPWRPDYVTKVFARLVKEAGLRPARLHDLRHGRASLMIQAGIDISVISKMLGHSSVQLTSDVYAHLLEGVGQAAAQKADDLVPRRSRDQSVTSRPSGGESDPLSPRGERGVDLRKL